MPNQRNANKRQVGGYIDEMLAEEIGKAGMDKTEFLEWATVRGLLVRGRISIAEIKKMADEDRIKATTILSLQREGLIK